MQDDESRAPRQDITAESLAESIPEAGGHPPEWHYARGEGVGASEVGQILTGGALRVYHGKTRAPELPEPPPNFHQFRGRIMEPVFADLWARAKDERVRRIPQRAHPDEPWARANIDRQAFATEEKPTRLVEVKSPSKWMYEKLLEEGSRIGTICQVQWGMYVTGYEAGVYVAGNTDTSPVMFQFEQPRDDELIVLLAVRMKAFWHDHVLARVPPNPDEWELIGAELTDHLQIPEATPLPNITEARLIAEVNRYLEARSLRTEAGDDMQAARDILEPYVRAAVGDGKATLGRATVGFEATCTPRKLNELDLRDHQPIDRDAFVRWLRDYQNFGSTVKHDPDVVAESLSLDLERFVTGGVPGTRWSVRERN